MEQIIEEWSEGVDCGFSYYRQYKHIVAVLPVPMMSKLNFKSSIDDSLALQSSARWRTHIARSRKGSSGSDTTTTCHRRSLQRSCDCCSCESMVDRRASSGLLLQYFVEPDAEILQRHNWQLLWHPARDFELSCVPSWRHYKGWVDVGEWRAVGRQERVPVVCCWLQCRRC